MNNVPGYYPSLTSGQFGFFANVLDASTIRVVFSEPVTNSALIPSAYTLLGISGSPALPFASSVSFYDNDGFSVEVKFVTPLTPGAVYSLSISGVISVDGNTVAITSYNFQHSVPSPVKAIGAFMSSVGNIDLVFDRPVFPYSSAATASLVSSGGSNSMTQNTTGGHTPNVLRFTIGSVSTGAGFSVSYSDVKDASLYSASGSVDISFAFGTAGLNASLELEGSTASVTASGEIVTMTGLTGMSADMVGGTLTLSNANTLSGASITTTSATGTTSSVVISGTQTIITNTPGVGNPTIGSAIIISNAANSANNGTFTVLAYFNHYPTGSDPAAVVISNPDGVGGDANNGSIHWQINTTTVSGINDTHGLPVITISDAASSGNNGTFSVTFDNSSFSVNINNPASPVGSDGNNGNIHWSSDIIDSPNNGTFTIASYIDSTSVTITNGSAVTDHNNRSISWYVSITNDLVVTGLSGMGPQSVGGTLTLSGAATTANNGTFNIIHYVNPDSVIISNPSGVESDAHNGFISWSYGLQSSDFTTPRATGAFVSHIIYSQNVAVIDVYFSTPMNDTDVENVSNWTVTTLGLTSVPVISVQTFCSDNPAVLTPPAGTSFPLADQWTYLARLQLDVSLISSISNQGFIVNIGSIHDEVGVLIASPYNQITALPLRAPATVLSTQYDQGTVSLRTSGEISSFGPISIYDSFTGSGSAASINIINGVVTLTGLTGMSPNVVGGTVTIFGAFNLRNNGSFLITDFISPTSITINNSRAITADGHNGSIEWLVVNNKPLIPTGTQLSSSPSAVSLYTIDLMQAFGNHVVNLAAHFSADPGDVPAVGSYPNGSPVNIIYAANYLLGLFNAHVGNTASHRYADVSLSIPPATDIPSSISLVNAISVAYEAHVANASVHVASMASGFTSSLYDIAFIHVHGVFDTSLYNIRSSWNRIIYNDTSNPTLIPSMGSGVFVGTEDPPYLASIIAVPALQSTVSGSTAFRTDTLEMFFSKPILQADFSVTNIVPGGSNPAGLILSNPSWRNPRNLTVSQSGMVSGTYAFDVVNVTDTDGNPIQSYTPGSPSPSP